MKSSNLPDNNWGVRTTGTEMSRKIIDTFVNLGFGTGGNNGNASNGHAYCKIGKGVECHSEGYQREHPEIKIFSWEEFQKLINPSIIQDIYEIF